MINSCPECLKRQREIDALTEENQRLKQKLRYQERKAQEGFFGSSTSSSKIPLKPDRPEKQGRKPKGARPGHLGKGRPGPDLVQGEHPSTVVGFYQKAAETQAQIVAAVESPALHPGIRRVQDLFRDNAHRLYHWIQNRQIPAENNLAERDLRPTVIARKVSFGSASDAGAQTRGTLMSILCSLKKQKVDVTKRLKEVLDQLAKDTHQDPFCLLLPEIPNPP